MHILLFKGRFLNDFEHCINGLVMPYHAEYAAYGYFKNVYTNELVPSSVFVIKDKYPNFEGG